MATWFAISPKNKAEKNAPAYASLGGELDGVRYVRLSNGAYVNFALTQEECRQRYSLGKKLSAERSRQIEERFEYELHR